MTRRWKDMLAGGLGISLLCLVLVWSGAAWAEEVEEAAPDEESATVAEEVAGEAAERAAEAAMAQKVAPEGDETAETTGEASAEAPPPSSPQSTLPDEETEVTGGTLVIITYLLLWLMLGAFLVVTLWRQGKLRSDVEGLERRIDALLD